MKTVFAISAALTILFAARSGPSIATDTASKNSEISVAGTANPLAVFASAEPSNMDAPLGALAKKQLAKRGEELALDMRFRLHLLAGNYEDALRDIAALRTQRGATARTLFVQHEVWLRAQLHLKQSATSSSGAATIEQTLAQAFAEVFAELDDVRAAESFSTFAANSAVQEQGVRAALAQAASSKTLDSAVSDNLLRQFQVYRVYRDLLPHTQAMIAKHDAARYVVEDDVLIRAPDGTTLSAMLMYKRSSLPQPALLMLNIYTDTVRLKSSVREMAARGYVGVMLDARGKRLSPERVTPYKNDGKDAHVAIDWISKQPWSNGSVGMLGGSYSGYAQWAAARYAHPALKTIVPAVAAIPGQGLPMENNVFLNANYGWAFYVANNRFLDEAVYFDNARWNALNTRWFESGRPYREFDAVDGTPNPWLQEWLKHPNFDAYWQREIPWRAQYQKINIPVLSITGYFDDGQISALEYFHQHLKYNANANHTLLIGPWDHFGSQARPAAELRGYEVDAVAVQPINDIIYQWMDHILKGAPRPALLADRINYQLMGSNAWQHAPSLAAAAPDTLRFYLQPAHANNTGLLATTLPSPVSAQIQTVDFADRKLMNNADYYPSPIIRDQLDIQSAPVYTSAALTSDFDLVGQFSADLKIRINKRDVDIGLTLYERTVDGRYFHLGYFLGRASYVDDPTKRRLLKPGEVVSLAIRKTRMTAKRLAAGSQLVLVADVNKNAFAQINYGTGKEVSHESVADAGEPLKIEWLSDSILFVPGRNAVESPSASVSTKANANAAPRPQ